MEPLNQRGEEVPSEKELRISSVDRMEDGVLIVEFSDGSIATYTVGELLRLRPDRIVPIEDHLSNLDPLD